MHKKLNCVNRKLNIAIVKVTNAYKHPNILAEFIAGQLKNRVSFRKAMKKAIELTEQAGTKGVQVQIAGRIDGKEIARVEWIREADNSGARELMCIRILGASNRRYAYIGDIVVAVIKQAVPNTNLEKSEVIRAVIVRTCKQLKRSNGIIIQYDDNAAVIIDQEGNPKGTRIFCAIARELRQLNFTKIVSLAPEIWANNGN
ncbi:large subunit ribosomal protein L14 [Vigna unguiculata]|uniref:50S ribosomal protein L14, chloroplastic n=1 Tax=Vigna unguiculata TaxID=3917 RepID=A0A4D6MTV4_VIGUN|nr:large subunit ribosomal protein L14 [Vigna unguiculata]